MLYEIILTDQCTRNCSFCNVLKTKHLETIDNIIKFHDRVIKLEKYHDRMFDVSLFGGEPLLNLEGLKKCIELFYNDNCEMTLYTNADLIDNIKDESFLNRINIQISAYDIFNDINKYKSIIDKFYNKVKYLQFAYTFSQNDINKFNQYIEICNKLNIQSKISLSHSLRSWSDIDNDKLYDQIFNLYYEYANYFYINQFDLILPKIIKNHFVDAVNFIYNEYSNKKTCLSQKKNVFYKGLFVKSCLLFKDKQIDYDFIPINCRECEYSKVCSKSCRYELKNGFVPDKLCIIQKAQIESMLSFIEHHSEDFKMKKLVQYYIDIMNHQEEI